MVCMQLLAPWWTIPASPQALLISVRGNTYNQCFAFYMPAKPASSECYLACWCLSFTKAHKLFSQKKSLNWENTFDAWDLANSSNYISFFVLIKVLEFVMELISFATELCLVQNFKFTQFLAILQVVQIFLFRFWLLIVTVNMAISSQQCHCKSLNAGLLEIFVSR